MDIDNRGVKACCGGRARLEEVNGKKKGRHACNNKDFFLNDFPMDKFLGSAIIDLSTVFNKSINVYLPNFSV